MSASVQREVDAAVAAGLLALGRGLGVGGVGGESAPDSGVSFREVMRLFGRAIWFWPADVAGLWRQLLRTIPTRKTRAAAGVPARWTAKSGKSGLLPKVSRFGSLAWSNIGTLARKVLRRRMQ